eukprot:TRINITY_DN14245_c0_g1_i1.p2 TRINITY_DN14245_c0_g1~~TRINITY_DN14245_c0_g1_i1.p2  ORF type:complete len:717 (+),score=203.99 TRINITY_DN14245_c0_g1_i1:65-2152(+)
MCGICLVLRPAPGAASGPPRCCAELAGAQDAPDPDAAAAGVDAGGWAARMLQRRGPDHSGATRVSLGPYEASLSGSVLSMRGDRVCAQPFEGDGGGVLLWNGEVFGGCAVDEHQGDTAAVHRLLSAAAGDAEPTGAIAAALSHVEGPYAFAFARAGRLWFGRDPLGRRSLVHAAVREGARQGLLVASSGPPLDCAAGVGPVAEVPPCGVFCAAPTPDGGCEVSCHRWSEAGHRAGFPLYSEMAARPPPEAAEAAAAEERYLDALEGAVRRRCELAVARPAGHAGPDAEETGARVGVLFSGGVDSMVLAALAHRAVPPHEPIDLCTVAFGDSPDATPDRLAARQGAGELRAACPGRRWNLVEVNITADDVLGSAPAVAALTAPCRTAMDINIASALWFAAGGEGSVAPGGDSAPAAPSSLVRRSGAAGGGDSSGAAADGDPFAPLVAALADEYSLVRSEKMLLGDLAKAHPLPWRACGYRRCSDYARAAERAGLVVVEGDGQLVRVAPPHWRPSDPQQRAAGRRVHSSARVLLVGMGADETLGGYARHRTAWQRGGDEALAQEMQMDCSRLWRRNLGRDDRVISDRGKEVRLPFLDERVLAALSALALRQVCDMRAPLGVGDKRLVRLCARNLGLGRAAGLQKRAIQFGTRIANTRADGTVELPSGALGLREAVARCLNPASMRKRPPDADPAPPA